MSQEPPSTRQEELRSFLFLAFVTAPVLAVLIVAGYGFAVWMFQLLSGQLPTS
ncbi:periplasmic nitrate reductase, NapE protein [Azoarcus olearius]|uniref:Periplasmic nitrate reductase accessory protein NapE n=1 Tax=Azoarcus sp. (strain BH72) TaxID=418699 RepID=A1K385_AZOSB|nr:periplasmic nitrate reductase, NapE protein [Azoarcus olearius]ANQ83817.1 putative periplasmic nitrate reductase accessory protein NapE [Azoarcus olearius]CAL93290.1 putative periplasmic nitrate reductase accessory protein NapE [Azoarcus olearius]